MEFSQSPKFVIEGAKPEELLVVTEVTSNTGPDRLELTFGEQLYLGRDINRVPICHGDRIIHPIGEISPVIAAIGCARAAAKERKYPYVGLAFHPSGSQIEEISPNSFRITPIFYLPAEISN